jgi:hypothetical protein
MDERSFLSDQSFVCCSNILKMGSEKQVALVVGASRGIGRQVAIDLAKNGYHGEL